VREWPGWGSHGGDERRVDVGVGRDGSAIAKVIMRASCTSSQFQVERLWRFLGLL
jgi:hypothetical protein